MQRSPLLRKVAFGISIVVMAAQPAAAHRVITTVAGRDWFLSADGKSANQLALSSEFRRIAVDAQGNLYIPDPLNNAVFKIGRDNLVKVVAGNGITGYSGDGGPATSASLNYPYAVAIDASGNLFIADSFNYRIRLITPDGVISTFAGTGSNGFGGDGGPRASTSFGFIGCLAFDSSGRLLICEGQRVRMITPADGIVSTLAGNGQPGYRGDGGPARSASLNDPTDIVSDPLGRIYIADFGNSVIRRVAVDGAISTYAGNGKREFSGDGGPALLAAFKSPDGLALDAAGNLYVSDSNDGRVRMISASGMVSTVAGSGRQAYAGDGGPAVEASFYFPEGLAWDALGRLLVADRGNSRIRAITLGGSMQTVAGNALFRATPDRTPATQAFLYIPSGVAVDNTGNLYVADTRNNVIRKITPDGLTQRVAGVGIAAIGPDGVEATRSGLVIPRGLTVSQNGDLIIADRGNHQIHRIGPDGFIHLVAGSLSAVPGFGGDGGPATQGLLSLPSAVAFDRAGSLYIAEEGNHRVRKVSNGVITTFAGNGLPQSSGDGRPATEASLNTPTGIAVDASGNVYIGEYFGYRIRKVTTAGTISTFAGTGRDGSTSDSGPAASADLRNVYALAFDTQGNLYFTEAFTHKVRRIAPDGTIATVAGSGKQGFLGDGGPAASAALNVPNGIAVGADGTVYVADSGNDCIRAILTVNPNFSASVAQLSFSATAGASPTPQQVIALGSSLQGMPFSGVPFTVSTTTVSGGGWLQVTRSSGAMPAVIAASIDPGALQEGAYRGVIQINAPGAVPPQVLINVTVVVAAANPPKIGLDSTRFAFAALAGGAISSRALSVSNIGSGALNITVRSSGGEWLTTSPPSGSATAGSPLPVTISVNPAGLQPGTYSGSVVVASSSEQITVPVTLAIAQPQPIVVLSQTGLTFTAVAQGGAPLPQSFGILNTGQGSMNWTVSTSTLSGGSNWLSVSQSSGTVARPYLDVSSVDVRVNAAGLVQGVYYGQVKVAAAAADNSPQSISVVLNVLPPGNNPGPEVQPTGLIFVGGAGSSPGSQSVMISNPTANAVTFASGQATIPAGGNWLTYLPSGASVSPGEPVKLVLQSSFVDLSSGIQRGVVTLLFSDGSIRNVSILAVVAPGAGDAAARNGKREASGCTPSRLVVQPTSLADQFSLALLQPARLEARVVDFPCGAPMTTGVVSAEFSNGDQQLSLRHVGNGVWSGTWEPKNGAQTQVGIKLLAVGLDEQLRAVGGQTTLYGTLRPGATTPLAVAVANAASGAGTFVSPGGLVSIYGQQLADRAGGAGSPPFPTELNGTQVLLGGTALPLRYVGDRQVNAQVPFELTVNTQHQLIVQRGTALSVPEDVVVAAAQPAVYTQDQSGKGAGVIVNASASNTLVTTSSLAKAGDVVVMYCNGLGAVSPPVPSGTAAPSAGPLSRTINPLSVTIGGVAAQVNFAGLAPGFPDLYQVNAVVPSGVAAGDQVPVVITIAGQTSPTVTMAVR